MHFTEIVRRFFIQIFCLQASILIFSKKKLYIFLYLANIVELVKRSYREAIGKQFLFPVCNWNSTTTISKIQIDAFNQFRNCTNKSPLYMCPKNRNRFPYCKLKILNKHHTVRTIIGGEVISNSRLIKCEQIRLTTHTVSYTFFAYSKNLHQYDLLSFQFLEFINTSFVAMKIWKKQFIIKIFTVI